MNWALSVILSLALRLPMPVIRWCIWWKRLTTSVMR